MTLKEAVDNFVQPLGRSTDIAFKRKVERDIVTSRGEILRRELGKGQVVQHMHANVITNLDWEKVKYGDQTYWKSVQKIPQPIPFVGRQEGFLFVGSSDGGRAFQFMHPVRSEYRISKFPLGQTYFYVDEYIYTKDKVKNLKIRDVFADLLYLYHLKNHKGELCVDLGPEITIHDALYEGIKRLLLETNNTYANLLQAPHYNPEVKQNGSDLAVP